MLWEEAVACEVEVLKGSGSSLSSSVRLGVYDSGTSALMRAKFCSTQNRTSQKKNFTIPEKVFRSPNTLHGVTAGVCGCKAAGPISIQRNQVTRDLTPADTAMSVTVRMSLTGTRIELFSTSPRT